MCHYSAQKVKINFRKQIIVFASLAGEDLS